MLIDTNETAEPHTIATMLQNSQNAVWYLCLPSVHTERHQQNNNANDDNNTQYGFVNYALELLVLKHFGLDVWEQIK